MTPRIRAGALGAGGRPPPPVLGSGPRDPALHGAARGLPSKTGPPDRSRAPRVAGRTARKGTQEGPRAPSTSPPRPIDNGRFGTRTIRFETGRLARQAAGSVVAYLDDETMLLSATTAGKHPKEHFDFFPLTVDVEERMYAAGRIPGSFFRREGRPARTPSSPAG